MDCQLSHFCGGGQKHLLEIKKNYKTTASEHSPCSLFLNFYQDMNTVTSLLVALCLLSMVLNTLAHVTFTVPSGQV